MRGFEPVNSCWKPLESVINKTQGYNIICNPYVLIKAVQPARLQFQ